MKDREIVWLVAFFDLPSVTGLEKRANVRFRNTLETSRK